jgi:hypothetical protein
MTLKEYQNEVDIWIKEHGVRYFDEKNKHLIINGGSWRVQPIDRKSVWRTVF